VDKLQPFARLEDGAVPEAVQLGPVDVIRIDQFRVQFALRWLEVRVGDSRGTQAFLKAAE
jgi:hypothetical protein